MLAGDVLHKNLTREKIDRFVESLNRRMDELERNRVASGCRASPAANLPGRHGPALNRT